MASSQWRFIYSNTVVIFKHNLEIFTEFCKNHQVVSIWIWRKGKSTWSIYFPTESVSVHQYWHTVSRASRPENPRCLTEVCTTGHWNNHKFSRSCSQVWNLECLLHVTNTLACFTEITTNSLLMSMTMLWLINWLKKQGAFCCQLINDLAERINSLNCGINIDDIRLGIRFYADDIAFIAPDQNSLQRMLDIVSDWCLACQLSLNSSKTKVVHFRPQSCSKTDCVPTVWSLIATAMNIWECGWMNI